MVHLKVDISKAVEFVTGEETARFQAEISRHRKSLYNKTGKGSSFLGWVSLPGSISESLFLQLEGDAAKIRHMSDVVVVCGIGGSYLGARAVIDALGNPFQPLLPKTHKSDPAIIYAGHHLDENYTARLLNLLDTVNYSVIVISKSGTTTEPAVSFRLLKNHIEKKYGTAEASKRIFAITDANKGALKNLATAQGYSTYVIPDDVGGRYSVLTPVGLLPVAAAGFNIRKIIEGAFAMETHLRTSENLSENQAATYAVARNILYRKGKTIELLAGYNPSLNFLIEWWKQLFGESEGKDNKGIFPAGIGLTTDLHSMGQYIQEGLRNIFETVLAIENTQAVVEIPVDPADLDGLNFISGKRINEVNRMAKLGTMMAHIDGGVPNLEISIPDLNERNIGELIYFFEMACGLSGYLLGVNPFDQPGVEAYKKNMFALLNKPGFEKESADIRKRL
ncbi:MAG TPA: glucose-6-phosphate isomerase [Bacteroidales bacterium]|nr:glucose-6-phosphate isomerase [Bacteroidales bacterium]